MTAPNLVLSLFPGIGLLDRAFEEEGYCVVRGPDVLWGGDIRRFHPPAGVFAGVIGGPPCQSFSSLVHLVRANGHEPRFGNLIPEYERCVSEAQPAWFLMENVSQAPEPVVTGYGTRSFLLDNSALNGGDGFGLEQRRVRRFTFGLCGQKDVPSLLRWIDLAVFLLPDAEPTLNGSGGVQWLTTDKEAGRMRQRTLCQESVDNTREAKGRTRRPALLSDPSAVPVKIGGSGKVKRTYRAPPSEAGHEQVAGLNDRKRRKAVSSSNGGAGAQRLSPGAGNSGRGRVRLADACRLQGLPEDFLVDAPFTADAKLKAVANGVPLPMGRAVARAVMEAISLAREG